MVNEWQWQYSQFFLDADKGLWRAFVCDRRCGSARSTLLQCTGLSIEFHFCVVCDKSDVTPLPKCKRPQFTAFSHLHFDTFWIWIQYVASIYYTKWLNHKTAFDQYYFPKNDDSEWKRASLNCSRSRNLSWQVQFVLCASSGKLNNGRYQVKIFSTYFL